MADQALKQSLVNELAIARSQIGVNKVELREDLRVGRRLKQQLRRNPIPWFTGAAVIGLLLSKMAPARRKVVVKPPKVSKFGKPAAEDMGKAGIAVALLNFGLQLAKATLLRLLREKFMSSFGGHVSGGRRGSAAETRGRRGDAAVRR